MKKWKIVLTAVAAYMIIEPLLKSMYLHKKRYIRYKGRERQKEAL